VTQAGAPPASRILVVGQDADVSVALHLHLERAGHTLVCVPGPAEMEPVLRVVAPQIVVLLLPATPDAGWGAALTAAASAARVGVRVMVVAPSREIVEPLAVVAGAERALSRAEVLSRPLSVVDRGPGRPAGAAAPPAPSRPTAAFPPPAPAFAPAGDAPGFTPAGAGSFAPAPSRPPPAAAPLLGTLYEPPPRPQLAAPPPGEHTDLLSLIDEELVEARPRPPPNARVEVNVSLVSEHNFFVGVTRRIDSGGVFIATSMPPQVGTRVQVRLGLADGRKIDLEGEVAFLRGKSATTGRQPPGCGVRLQSLPGWAVDAIERFFLARQPIVYAPT
jgi:Tfp pilus assembly protein PilZ